MLHYPDDVAGKIDRIDRRAKRNKQSPMETAKALLAVEPNFGPGLLLMARALEISGDSAQAEEVFWKALAQCPCRAEIYLYLGGLVRRRRPKDPLGLRLEELAFWKFSMALAVRPDVVAFMRPILTELGPAEDPYTYELLAKAAEDKFSETYGRAAAEEDARFAPYQVLNDLQRESDIEVERETLHKVLYRPEEFAPLLYAAVREWANADPRFRTLALPGLQIFVAILGEIGGPELIADLLELSGHPDISTFRHVHWALHRLGQRWPAEALETLRAAARNSSTGLRCGLAEQLNLLPEIPGISSALALLVENFGKIAKDEDAPYLLAIVTDSIAERGEVEAAHTILSRCQPLLPKDARAWLEKTINGDEEFVPTLVEEELDELDIEEVCLERTLMDDEGEEDGEIEDGEEGDLSGIFDDALEEFEEDELLEAATDPVFTPSARRNDPCWCGSGKKYKKCHLRADEEAQRAVGEVKPPPRGSAGVPLTLRVFKGMSRWHSKADGMRARKMYFGSSGEVEGDESGIDGLVQFLLHDFRDAATGRTLIEHYLEDAGSQLTARERTELESLRDARFGLYETHRIEKGRGVHLRNVFSGESFFVEDITQSREAALWDCALVRVQLLNGRYILAGNGTAVARLFLDKMKAFVKHESQAAGQSEVEFVRANSHRLRLHLVELHERGLENLTVTTSEVTLGEATDRTKPLPPEIEHRVILEFKAKHYATWPDAALPALDGLTPRQAVRTKAGREAVLSLVRTMENGEARGAKTGQPVFDFRTLRRELGLEKD